MKRGKLEQRIFRRMHGIGNVLMLLPVLESISNSFNRTTLVTRKEWVESLSVLSPNIKFTHQENRDALDLDILTKDMKPEQHRTVEFARLIGKKKPVSPINFNIPESWRKEFINYSDAILFAPEAGHPARMWPTRYITNFSEKLIGKPIILTGTSHKPLIPCDMDLRGKLSLKQLLGLMSVAKCIIAFDSGALHLAMSVGLPAIAIFSGINPNFRIRSCQTVLALQANLDCCPCNKDEICSEKYDCLKRITPEIVIKRISRISNINQLEIERI